MTIEEHSNLYNKFDLIIAQFIKDNNLYPTEETYELLKQVIEDIGESWYRQSLGKISFH